MFKFKKKEKVNPFITVYETIDKMSDNFIGIFHDHLDLIKDLGNTDKEIIGIVCEQQKAINELRIQMETMQKLVNKAEES